jgi:exodeoxyribonuclease-3
MRILSFNVNGIRAAKDRILSCAIAEHPDILCFQEIKTQSLGDLEFLRHLYPHISIHTAKRKGYSGVAILSKDAPIEVTTTFEGSEGSYPFLEEGRILTAEFKDWFLVCVYSPNSKPKLERLEERMIWEEWLLRHMKSLKVRKPVILCGDLNVCHTLLDYWMPKHNPKTSALTPQEKGAMTTLLTECDLVDSFRHLQPEDRTYSYWSPWANSKQENKGWRLDYFLVSKSLVPNITDAKCLDCYCKSDHGPVYLDLKG